MSGSKVNTSQDTQLGLLHAISRTVSAKLTLDEILQELIGIAVGFTHCDACLVYLIEHATNEVVLRASQVPHAAALGNLRMKVGEGVTGWVARR